MSARTRAIVAAALAIAAVIALVVAFTGESAPASTSTGRLATPLWSARRVPQPVVDAVGAQHLQRALDQSFSGSGVCFLVQADGHVLASRNADTPLIGASTQKLLVAAAALATLTPDFTYETRVVAPSRTERRQRRQDLAGRLRRPRPVDAGVRGVHPGEGQDPRRRHHQPRSARRRDRREGRAEDPWRRRRRRFALRHRAVPPHVEGELPHRAATSALWARSRSTTGSARGTRARSWSTIPR